MRVLFLGMPGSPFSYIVLERLLAAGVTVVAALLAGQRFRPLLTGLPPQSVDAAPAAARFELPLLNPQRPPDRRAGMHRSEDPRNAVPPQRLHTRRPADPLHLAWQAGIPTYECGDIGRPDVTGWLSEMSPDVACVACWPRIIPTTALGTARRGFLNLHPSLLPAYRGPHPLFWQFRAGETRTGVTLHWIDAGIDTGDIAAQRRIHFPDGIRAAAADAQCAAAGGDLLAETLTALAHGQAERRRQPPGSYFPAPTPDDFALDSNWPARRAFNFMRATAEYGVPFRLEVDGAAQWLRDALAWQTGEPSASPVDGGVRLRFRDGALWAQECPALPEP